MENSKQTNNRIKSRKYLIDLIFDKFKNIDIRTNKKPTIKYDLVKYERKQNNNDTKIDLRE